MKTTLSVITQFQHAVEEMITKVEKMIMANKLFKVFEITTALGTSIESVTNILHMNKVCTHWVPRILNSAEADTDENMLKAASPI